ncbi:Hypothetical predicted protein [Paramuricea clavata]|uniref:Uncharacterized protein n=1 Tax=Paramuricea clavata TaxID=317549 RepID=A0A7D9D6V7_PARCT|nr:Hypothetical predicted protein [Paramuricea clavata]
MASNTSEQLIDWVKSKLRQLRNSFTKARKPPPSGSARRNPTKRTSWILDILQFLDAYVASRPTTSNMEVADPITPTDVADSDNDESGDILADLDPDGDDDNLLDDVNDTTTARPTKLPLKSRPKSMKKKLQEEEFEVMKGLASSIAQNNKEKKKAKPEGGESEAFGNFVIESIKKLDPTMQHIVQYHINDILFQAQMGMLGQGQTQMSGAKQQSSRQVQQFSPWLNHDENILNS